MRKNTNAKAETELDALEGQLTTNYRMGKINESLLTKKKHWNTEAGDRLQSPLAKARWAQVHLLMEDVESAIKCLQPYLDRRSGKLSFDRSRFKNKSSFAEALLLSLIASILYRERRYKYGQTAAELAHDRMSRVEADQSRIDHAILDYENRVWLARLASRNGKLEKAEETLRGTTAGLDAHLRGSVGGVDRIRALALDAWASLDWSRGNLQGAQLKIYQALALLRSGSVSDSTQLGLCLYAAGRIESTHSVTGFATALRLLDEARKELQRIEHPWIGRVMVQAAHCHVKAGQIDEARAELESARKLPVDSEYERAFIRAEILLTETWILEKEAFRHPDRWESCLISARKLDMSKNKSRRLDIEGKLHHGRALVHGTPEQRKRGLKKLAQALQEARTDDRRKIETAVQVAMSEGWLAACDAAQALKHWEEANRLIEHVESGFLPGWIREVGRRLNAPIRIDLRPEQSLAAGKKQCERELVAYHAARAASKADVGRRLDVTAVHAARLLKEHRLRLGGKEPVQ